MDSLVAERNRLRGHVTENHRTSTTHDGRSLAPGEQGMGIPMAPLVSATAAPFRFPAKRSGASLPLHIKRGIVFLPSIVKGPPENRFRIPCGFRCRLRGQFQRINPSVVNTPLTPALRPACKTH
jgi:hypothetical protein